MAERRARVTVILDAQEFTRFERYCASRGFKKSTLIARLVRDHLNAENIDMQPELPFGAAESNEPTEERDA